MHTAFGIQIETVKSMVPCTQPSVPSCFVPLRSARREIYDAVHAAFGIQNGMVKSMVLREKPTSTCSNQVWDFEAQDCRTPTLQPLILKGSKA